MDWFFISLVANNESSEVCGIIKHGRRVKLNRSQAVNVHKMLKIRYLRCICSLVLVASIIGLVAIPHWSSL